MPRRTDSAVAQHRRGKMARRTNRLRPMGLVFAAKFGREPCGLRKADNPILLYPAADRTGIPAARAGAAERCAKMTSSGSHYEPLEHDFAGFFVGSGGCHFERVRLPGDRGKFEFEPLPTGLGPAADDGIVQRFFAGGDL